MYVRSIIYFAILYAALVCPPALATGQASTVLATSHSHPAVLTVLMAEQRGERDQVLPLTKNMIQLFNYLEEVTKLKIEIRRYPWRRVLHNAENGEGMVFGIYKNPERLQIFHFSEPVYSDKIWLMSRCEDRLSYNSIQDLKGKTIGIVQGSNAGEEFDSQVNILFRAEYNTSSLAGRFSKLYQKRMDAFLLYDPRTNLREMQKEFNQIYAADIDEYRKKKTEVFCIVPKPINVIDAHFAMSNHGDHSLLEKLDKALIQARKSGELERIFSK